MSATVAVPDTGQKSSQACQPADPPAEGVSGAQVGSVVLRAGRRLRWKSVAASLSRFWRKLCSWVWYLIEELFEEFQPWLKWIIFDAALTLLVAHLAKRFEFLQRLFEAVGWS